MTSHDINVEEHSNVWYDRAKYGVLPSASLPTVHEHRWQGIGMLPPSDWPGGPAWKRHINVIQSCECGEVRRVEVPE